MRPPLPLKAIFGWGGILFLSLAFAARGVGVSPPRYELFLAPGERASGVFHVFTTETQPQGVEMELLDYLQTGDGNFVFLPGGSIPYSLVPYLSIALNPFEVVANRDRTIPFTVTAPPNGEGSYWTAIAFTTTQTQELEARGIQFSQQVRVVGAIYVTIKGTERPEAALEAAAVDDGKLITHLVNKGNTYLRLQPVLILKDAKGQEILRQEETPILLLRDASIKLTFTLPSEKLQEAVLAALELKPLPPIMLPYTLYIEAGLP